ncbi:hypothetical protein EZH22_01385 [Xanthobacter dioxanivorans]|uniref:Uncharacterized protein n=1 Tax=Xanthobacter dioxanivorans TaxID=2528964 RepID=A0A974PQ73_9HYPH|nr:hypothetical protein [Xanthobacter dioxanivorans]QRG07130.1 hypothetical protein EZH22_01385 [Xanthobacter dioxanivorans]
MAVERGGAASFLRAFVPARDSTREGRRHPPGLRETGGRASRRSLAWWIIIQNRMEAIRFG